MGNERSKRRELLFNRFRQSQFDSGLPCDNGSLICPVCWKPQQLSEFTLEHIVPKAVGGRRTTLTCRICNNQQGKELDVHLVKYHQVHEALNGFGAIPSQLTVNERNVTVNVTATTEPKQISMQVVGRASHPSHISGLHDDLQDGKADELVLRMNLGYNKNRMQTALLRSGFLSLFHRFGYSYVTRPLAQRVRERIVDPTLTTFRLSSFIAGIQRWDFPFDRPYFVVTRRLNSMPYFLVVIRCRIETTQYHGVALPGVELDDEKFFHAFEEYSRANRSVAIQRFSEGDVVA